MARDSSPFAQRLKKALASRSGNATSDAQPGQPDAPVDETAVHETVAADTDPTPPDEQPTGEFPALDGAAVESPVPDAPIETPDAAEPHADAAFSADEDQPTTSAPAVSASWIDPPSDAPGSAGDHDTRTSSEGASSVEWSSPADDILEPVAGQPEPSASVPDSPYLPDPQPEEDVSASAAGAPAWELPDNAPAWDADAESTPSAEIPLPIWDTPVRHDDAAPSASDPSDATPAWVDEAASIADPIGPVVPPPLSSYTTDPEPAPATDGPTLSPPVIGKRDKPLDDASQTGDAGTSDTEHDAALAAVPDESEPVWTPTALHEALSLDEDESDDAVDATPEAQTDLQAETDTPSSVSDDGPAAESDTQTTQIHDAVPAPPARKGLRGRLGRRKGNEAGAPVPATELPLTGETPEEPAEPSQAAGDEPTPDTPQADEPVVDETAPSADSDSDSDSEAWADTPDIDREDEDRTPVDPGSITSRFAAIGRRALSRRAKAEAAAAESAADTDAASATTEPSSEVASPEPAASLEEPLPFKPSFSERAALRRRVRSLRARRDAGLAELGAIVLDQSRFGDPTGGTLVRRRTSALADLDGEIAAIEAALEEDGPAEAVAQLQVVHCSSCSALLGPADHFCASCGTARPSADAGDGDDTVR